MKKRLLAKRDAKSKAKPKAASRITNETLAEHREKILAEGRRFKYPVQYARHKLVINAILVVVVALMAATGVFMWLLYGSQNTANFTYRITQLIPVPVAKVDGTNVRYSDYLRSYNMSTYYLMKNEHFSEATKDGQAQANHVKRESLDLAIENAYAGRLAEEANISISQDELDRVIKRFRQTSSGTISDDTYERSAQLFYNMSVEEFSEVMHDSLLRSKVRFHVDQAAKDRADRAQQLVTEGAKSIEDLAAKLGDDAGIQAGVSGPVNWAFSYDPIIGELAQKEVNKIYGPFETKLDAGEGYYFIRPTDINKRTMSYEFLYIPLEEFANRIESLHSKGKITEYIRID